MLEAGRNPQIKKSEKQRDNNRLGTTYKAQGSRRAASLLQTETKKKEREVWRWHQTRKVLGFYQVKGEKNGGHNFLFWVPSSELKF